MNEFITNTHNFKLHATTLITTVEITVIFEQWLVSYKRMIKQLIKFEYTDEDVDDRIWIGL